MPLCVLCEEDAASDAVEGTFVRSIACPRCGAYEMTTHAVVAWSALEPERRAAVLPRLRDIMRGKHLILGRADIERVAREG